MDFSDLPFSRQKWIWFDTLVFFSFPVHYTNQKPKISILTNHWLSILTTPFQIISNKFTIQKLMEISKFTTEFDKQTQTDSLHWVDWQCWIQIWQYSWSWEYSSLSFRLFLWKTLKNPHIYLHRAQVVGSYKCPSAHISCIYVYLLWKGCKL